MVGQSAEEWISASRPKVTARQLSLVIPAYNEGSGIRQAIDEADHALAALFEDYEILVVDDGSSDDTAGTVAEAVRSTAHVRLLRHPENRGYGAALRTGFEAARFNRVAFTDADCQFYLADLACLVPLTDRHPLAVGYRMSRQDSWRRRFFSWGYNTLARTLLGTRVRDCDCALKVFRGDALALLLPDSHGFFANTEMLTRARRRGFHVAEVGVRHRPRLRGRSKVSLGDIPRTLAALLPFWWSHVLFPTQDRKLKTREPHHPLTLLASSPWMVLLLIVAGLFLFFCRLGCPLQEPQEARYAEIPRQMLAEGRWIVPVLHGEPYCDKPPLLYWLVMAGYSVWGVHDWVARLVPSMAALGTVLLAYWWGRKAAGPVAALAGALILCLSVRYVYLARMLTMDSLLCLWTVAGLATAHQAVRSSTLRWRWWLLSALACSLGLLTKGPVALVLVVAPVIVYQFLDRRVARPNWSCWLVYLTLALGLACPWYLAAMIQEPDFAGHFFWKHNILRFVEPFDHVEPVWFYFPGILVGMLPGSLLLPGLVRSFRGQTSPVAEDRPSSLGFYLLAFSWSLAFFSLSGCKRATYILPALPPLALALGCYLESALRGDGLNWMKMLAPQWASSWVLGTAATLGLFIIGVHEVLPSYARKFSLRGQVRPHAEAIESAHVRVACYPRRWDSVGFYLRRNDVLVYTREQRGQLIEDLREQPITLLFVKADHSLREFLDDLPGTLEFEPCGRQGNVSVGWVHPRQEAPLGALAQR